MPPAHSGRPRPLCGDVPIVNGFPAPVLDEAVHPFVGIPQGAVCTVPIVGPWAKAWRYLAPASEARCSSPGSDLRRVGGEDVGDREADPELPLPPSDAGLS